MRRVAILLLLVGLSLGCTSSLEQIRQRPPAFAGDFSDPYQVVSRCIYEQLNAQTGKSSMGGLPTFVYRLDDDPGQRRARIDAMSLGGPPSAEFEITVSATAAETSRIEYRRRWDGFWSTDAAAWAVVIGCSQRQAQAPSGSEPTAVDSASATREVVASRQWP